MPGWYAKVMRGRSCATPRATSRKRRRPRPKASASGRGRRCRLGSFAPSAGRWPSPRLPAAQGQCHQQRQDLPHALEPLVRPDPHDTRQRQALVLHGGRGHRRRLAARGGALRAGDAHRVRPQAGPANSAPSSASEFGPNGHANARGADLVSASGRLSPLNADNPQAAPRSTKPQRSARPMPLGLVKSAGDQDRGARGERDGCRRRHIMDRPPHLAGGAVGAAPAAAKPLNTMSGAELL